MGGRRDLVADYFEVFNNEVREFLEPSTDRELRGSHIHADSKIKWLEEPEEFQAAGSERANVTDGLGSASNSDTFSSSSESDSRYVTAEESAGEGEEDIRSQNYVLGSHWNASEKSTFFHCLSRYSIHRLDEWHGGLPYKSKFEILVYYQVLQYNLKEMQRYNMIGGLLSFEEFPIAYEMDEFYVQFEEFMSRQVRIEYEQPATDTEESLISLTNWNKRWQAIYCKAGIEELAPLCSEPLPHSEETIQFLTGCVKAYTKRLLWYAVVSELDKLSISKQLLFKDEEMIQDDDMVLNAGDAQLPHVVTPNSIYRALGILKQEGFSSPTLPETVLQTLEKFEVEPKPKGKLFKNRQVTMSLLPTLIQHSNLSLTAVGCKQESLSCNAELAQVHKKLHTIHQGRKRKIEETFVQDDPLNCIDNPLEFELCDWENEFMDAGDRKKSLLHQHRLMAYYSDDKDKNLIQIQAISPETSLDCPVQKLPTSLLKQFLHSNT
ncbi:uncharacterized protein ZBAI_08109 [Zygosaccharomyces bailii ISA1307]|nr:uncharacterized protein ZBAI_08109 [Zygosaccharomyces bailii ISA1307]